MINNMPRKFGETWACGFCDMHEDRQTERQTYSSQYFAPLIVRLTSNTYQINNSTQHGIMEAGVKTHWCPHDWLHSYRVMFVWLWELQCVVCDSWAYTLACKQFLQLVVGSVLGLFLCFWPTLVHFVLVKVFWVDDVSCFCCVSSVLVAKLTGKHISKVTYFLSGGT